mgnify:CR=1 FL=1
MRKTFSNKQQVALYALALNPKSYKEYYPYLVYDRKKGFKELIDFLVGTKTKQNELEDIKRKIKETYK